MEERRDARRPALWGRRGNTDKMLVKLQADVLSHGGRETRRLVSYLRFRPCMTASGPEDTGASRDVRQFLKSAHWIKESALSAIRVLREMDRK